MKPVTSVKILLDSVSNYESNKNRVITLVTFHPRIINAELNTHGNISKNASSSRAIGFPFTKTHDNIPYLPQFVQTPSKSMHGDELITKALKKDFDSELTKAFHIIKEHTEQYKDVIHKQHLNRYLEPWGMQTMVMTANIEAWDNFLNLRTATNADTNIVDLALLIESAIDQSISVPRANHIPMVTNDELQSEYYSLYDLSMISAGRIAKVSYSNHYTLEDSTKSLLRANMLKNHKHKSVFGHQLYSDLNYYKEGVTHQDCHTGELYSGRIKGWVKLRKLIWLGLSETKEHKAYELLQ